MKPAVAIALVCSLLANLALWHFAPPRPRTAAGAAIEKAETDAHRTPASAPNNARDENNSAPVLNSAADSAASADELRRLADRLRAAGFPMDVMRAMIAAAVDEQFRERRLAVIAAHPRRPYWKPARWDLALWSALDQLRREQLQTVRDVLGGAAISPEIRASYHRAYGPVSDEKIDALVRLQMDYAELSRRTEAEILAGAGSAELPWERAQLDFIEREKRRDIEALLTPDELREFDRRQSPAAAFLRSRFRYFDATEQEYVALHDLLHAAYTQAGGEGARLSGSSKGITISVGDAPTVTIAPEQLNSVLGEARFAEYQRGLDSGYQTAVGLVRRLGLPQENAARVYDLQQLARNQADEIRRTSGQTPEQIQNSLVQLARRHREQLAHLITPAGLETYETTPSGAWLRRVERPTPRPAAPPPNP